MTLREFLEGYKDTSKVYLEEYEDDDTSIKIGLFQNYDIIPEKYLNSKVVRWNYKLDIINMERISMMPSVILRVERD